MAAIYIFASVILVSLVSLLAVLTMKHQLGKRALLALLSLSAGTLLATVFFHFLPELAEDGLGIEVGGMIIGGFLLFFLLEKSIHWHHREKDVGHGHAYHLAPLNLIGDAVHNFLDGLVIAGTYAVSVPLGVAVTLSVAVHELPQEIADYGVLLYSGLSRRKAILFNFLAALTAVIGAGVGILFTHELELVIVPFAAGGFLYIAASSLVPELHKHCSTRDTIEHVGMMLAGIAIMLALAVYLPGR